MMQKFLDACHEIENLTGRIYRKLAADSTYAENIRETFRKLGSDELAHARAIDLVRQTPDCAHQVSNLLSGSKVDECLDAARKFLQRVEVARLDEKEALELALRLEEGFIRVHANNALTFTNPRLTKIFDDLSQADQVHLNTLRDCLHRWQREQKSDLPAEFRNS